MEILTGAMDVMTMYANPQLYYEVHKGEKEEYTRKNTEFSKHSNVGRQTGRMVVTPQVMAAIKKAHLMKQKMQDQQSWRVKDNRKVDPNEPPVVG